MIAGFIGLTYRTNKVREDVQMSRKIAYIDREKIRLYLVNQRVHHGACGFLMAAAALKSSRIARMIGVVGVALAVEDAHDWKIWFKREALPGQSAA